MKNHNKKNAKHTIACSETVSVMLILVLCNWKISEEEEEKS